MSKTRKSTKKETKDQQEKQREEGQTANTEVRGHCNSPFREAKNIQLARIVATTRLKLIQHTKKRYYKRDRLTEEHRTETETETETEMQRDGR